MTREGGASDADGVPIGEASRRSGVRASALRYYERKGLIGPARRQGGRRVYDASIFDALALIRLAQEAGFTINEIKHLLKGSDHTPPSVRWQALARKKLEEVRERIERATRMEQLLQRLIHCEESLGQCVQERMVRLTGRSAPAPNSR